MKQKIFTVYDVQAKAHLQPFFLPTEGMAIRTFTDCVNNPEHQFCKHPEDFVLQEIGEFDEESGEIFSLEVPQTHGTGVKFKAS